MLAKSSLLNALVGQRVARTSNTPGRTQMINLFEWNGVMLADLPGYGYAKASKADIMHWSERLENYLLNRNQLVRLFILIDSRHGLKDSDLEIMQFCDINAIPYQLVLTKTDKTKQIDGARRREEVAKVAANHPACTTNVVVTSAEKKFGIEDLRCEIINVKNA